MWKISNFDKLFQQALSGEVPAIHSIPFYSGIPGKLPIFLNLNCLMLFSHEFPPITISECDGRRTNYLDFLYS